MENCTKWQIEGAILPCFEQRNVKQINIGNTAFKETRSKLYVSTSYIVRLSVDKQALETLQDSLLLHVIA